MTCLKAQKKTESSHLFTHVSTETYFKGVHIITSKRNKYIHLLRNGHTYTKENYSNTRIITDNMCAFAAISQQWQ